jgi:hypothetical protein
VKRLSGLESTLIITHWEMEKKQFERDGKSFVREVVTTPLTASLQAECVNVLKEHLESGKSVHFHGLILE